MRDLFSPQYDEGNFTRFMECFSFTDKIIFFIILGTFKLPYVTLKLAWTSGGEKLYEYLFLTLFKYMFNLREGRL